MIAQRPISRVAYLAVLLGAVGCAGNVPGTGGPDDNGTGGATTGSGGATITGAGGTTVTGTGGGTTGVGGAGGAVTGAGGAVTGAGGSMVQPPPALDCGPIGVPIVNSGPPKNRINYVIVADGYTSTTVNTTLMTHVNNAMTARFSAIIGEPYVRYKNFVNICLFKTISQTDGISQTGASTNSTIFNCFGDDTSRLATCDTRAAMTALTANTPAGMTVDWHSIVLNNSRWWNTGSSWMLWSGGNADGPKGAMHEGGHGFHQLADEYGTCTGANCGSNTMGTGTVGTENAEINSTGNPMTTGGKWDMWIGTTQTGATGLQGTWLGSRYVGTGQYRPSANSMMNSLFGNNPNTSFNSVSREQMIFTIWRRLTPIDSTTPAAGAVANPGVITVNVIDPAVISVDWTVDGVTTVNGGTTFDTSKLAAGTHMISAKAYDNASTDWVRNKSGTCPTSVTNQYCSRTAWPRSQQTVTWTVTK
jgi:hypothetical protein